METSYLRRPFKVAFEKKGFVGIVACSLKELKEKAALKFSIDNSNINVYLANDDTLIDDEEYFSFCQNDTKFIIKNGRESSQDFVDGYSLERTESFDRATVSNFTSNNVFIKFQSVEITDSLLLIPSLTNKELNVLSEISPKTLSEKIRTTEQFSEILLDQVYQELQKRTALHDATQLLQLFKNANKNMETATKRKKAEDDSSKPP